MLLLLISFFFTDPASTEIYTLSLHDALPISSPLLFRSCPTQKQSIDRGRLSVNRTLRPRRARPRVRFTESRPLSDRKSTRLNSSHTVISYAVFCLKKKKKKLKNNKT